jgi:hypothetical protein
MLGHGFEKSWKEVSCLPKKAFVLLLVIWYNTRSETDKFEVFARQTKFSSRILHTDWPQTLTF